MILGEEAAKALIGYRPNRPRMMKARFRTASGKATIVQAYAPTTSATEQEMDEFYETLLQTMQGISSQDLNIVMGDFNVGKDWKTWRGALGKHGYGEENERGERLLNFCLNNNLQIMNTAFFQRKANRKWTWESPDGRTKNMIDFIMVNNRWRSAVTKCRTFARPDMASDHKLVMAGIRIKLRKMDKRGTNRRYDMEGLRDEKIKNCFRTQLENSWRQSKEKEMRGNVEGNKERVY